MRSTTLAVLLVLIVALAYANEVRSETHHGEDTQHLDDSSPAPRVRRWGRYGGWGGGYGGGWGGGYGGGWRGGWGGGYGRGGWGGGYGGYGYGWGR